MAASEALLDQARAAAAAGDPAALWRAVGRLGDSTDELPAWSAAARLLAGVEPGPWARRQLRVAVVGSHTTDHLTALLPVALARHGIVTETYQAPYGQYEQEILDPASGLYRFRPHLVVLLIDERELRWPAISADPGADLAAETERWTSLWAVLRERTGAEILQTTFLPRADCLGHLALSTPGARRQQVRRLNLELGERLPGGVRLIDTELLAGAIGTARWSDDRFWFLAKQAIGLGALAGLARELARVSAAAIGLTRKVLVLDLDNTLWGGVIGEDGLAGIAIGNGTRGEAYQAFQEALLALRRQGLLLAVVSKNNPAEAEEPFRRHPDMRLQLSDFVAFRASWDDKAAVIRQLSEDLSLGLDSFVFVDDNPFEREAVRQALPEVDVLDLPTEATGYPAALTALASLEPGRLTAEDATRTEQYQGLARAGQARAVAATPEEFLAGLQMEADLVPVTEESLPRVVQLIGKTNQFNLTGRRHSQAVVQEMTRRDGGLHLTLRMRDRFVDHGLVGVVLAEPDGTDLRVDTWLMSCRVLGRGVEIATMSAVTDAARELGYRRVIGEHITTSRNEPARDAYRRSGFSVETQNEDRTTWVFDLTEDTVPDPGHVTISL